MFEISHTSNLFYIRKKSDVVEFFIWGKEFFGGREVLWGEILRVFFGGGEVKFWEEKSRVQSPESRVQSPVQLLG